MEVGQKEHTRVKLFFSISLASRKSQLTSGNMMRLNVRMKRTMLTPYIHRRNKKYEATDEPN